MAGKNIVGCSHIDRANDNESSAIPFDTFANILAVAGKTITMSTSKAKLICSNPGFGFSSKILSITL